ncbi:SAG family member [Eimeria mitis]|uniref:SAG family member n=1 Tax=Eimeria mitis TaxID=44415 RepID=U6K4P8_9EIME|nr:SAG family member [Eimeria mitis]CDJ31931.1 SAG family member [Eimeria mitis]
MNKTTVDYARTGTYAYAPQIGPTDGCSAAVSYWKKAYVNFGELPSKYEKEETGVYAQSRNRSLVALYNPKEGATVDCAYITFASDLKSRMLKFHLLCVVAFVFEEIWANIKEAIENSASASTQSALLATALFLLTSFVIL